MKATAKQIKFFVKENTWLSRGSYSDFGWGNGYVCLPVGHPCFGMGYDSIHNKYEINCNGRLTFSRPSNELKDWKEKPDGEYWIVGFDTAHSWDSLERWPKEAVLRETENLAKQFKNIKS